MTNDDLGRIYPAGECIVREGEPGECMYVIREGVADVYRDVDGVPTRVDSMQAGAIFGEIAIVEKTVRSATVRARTPVNVMTIDRKTFLRRVQEDPALALNVIRVLADRIRRLDGEIARLQQGHEAPASGSD